MFAKIAPLGLALILTFGTFKPSCAQAQGLAIPKPSLQKTKAHCRTKKEEVKSEVKTALEKALTAIATKISVMSFAPQAVKEVTSGIFAEEVDLTGNSKSCSPNMPGCVYLPAMVAVQVTSKVSRETNQDPRIHALSETPAELSQLLVECFMQDKSQLKTGQEMTVSGPPVLFLSNNVSYFLNELRFTVKLSSENIEPYGKDVLPSKQPQ
jgi:hypothetical protein